LEGKIINFLKEVDCSEMDPIHLFRWRGFDMICYDMIRYDIYSLPVGLHSVTLVGKLVQK